MFFAFCGLCRSHKASHFRRPGGKITWCQNLSENVNGHCCRPRRLPGGVGIGFPGSREWTVLIEKLGGWAPQFIKLAYRPHRKTVVHICSYAFYEFHFRHVLHLFMIFDPTLDDILFRGDILIYWKHRCGKPIIYRSLFARETIGFPHF